MRLFVYLLEAKGLPVEESYVKLKLGKLKSKSRVLKGTINPVWNEEFVFRVRGVDEILELFVYRPDSDPGFFTGPGSLVGRIRVPVGSVADDKQTLPPTWFALENPKTTGEFINEECGKLLLTLCLHDTEKKTTKGITLGGHSDTMALQHREMEIPAIVSRNIVGSKKIPEDKHLINAITSFFEKLFKKKDNAVMKDCSSDVSSDSSVLSEYVDCTDESSPLSSFEEAMKTGHLISFEQDDIPESLQGGILLDQIYVVSPSDLNLFLFAPNSQFRKKLAEVQGTTDVNEGPWTWNSEAKTSLTRLVTYTKGATKLVKAVKTTEEQLYIRADGKDFAILINASTPDVPYGNTFKIEMLYKIMPGPELPSGEESSRLVVSWRVNFSQNVLVRGMIESGAKQGLKENFSQFADLLSQSFKTVDAGNISDKYQALAALQIEQESNIELAIRYFWNSTVLSSVGILAYVVVHIILCKPTYRQGLEFYGLDLPDSLSELITSGILVLLLEHVYYLILHFIQARLRRGSDHGMKGQGDGWVLTIGLIEGSNLASLDSTGLPDPFVVFTCNGETRTSSVKLQTHDPQWNEILEFDASEEPPSVLDVQVRGFDGPFNNSTSLGDAEINFLKHTTAELADIWVSLDGNIAQVSQSKLHLRIYLENKKGVEAMTDYLMKMEKEVGKKLHPRSPHSNSTFQKLFNLPPEEFLIRDFSCYLKRKMPLQGRLFLSARIIGFYANLLMHKTKFFFLWEDIEDIQITSPSLPAMNSLVIVLRKGRGLDASHGAKAQDEEGRLVFCFQSFSPLDATARIIMALWREKNLTSFQKTKVEEDEYDQDLSVHLEDHECFLDLSEGAMSKVYSAELSVDIELLMEVFGGGDLEENVMAKSGCLNYVATPWKLKEPSDTFVRRVYYKFSHQISIFGGKVVCTQQKSRTANGWTIDEVMCLSKFPFSDHFQVLFRYQIENNSSAPGSSKCNVYIRINWLKSIKFQDRISRNMTEKFANRLKDIFELAVKEILQSSTSIPT